MTEHRTLFEISWEVCNMVGGIHTVLVTKLNKIRERYGDNYVLLGPDISRIVEGPPVFREELWAPRLLDSLLQTDVHVRMGRWLVPGEPRTLLVNYSDLYEKKDQILARYWEKYQLDSLFGEWDYYDPMLFAQAAGIVVERYYLDFLLPERRKVVVQCHEWMAAGAILHLRDRVPEVGTVFTTHATTLGRSLAANREDPNMYRDLPSVDPTALASELGVVAKHSMEVVAARTADVFTTVSEITARECEYLLGKKPDLLLLNALGDAFPPQTYSSTEAQKHSRERLLQLAHLTTGTDYDPDNTVLVLSSGRYEYTNKGLDVYLRALAQLRDQGAADANAPRVVAFAACPAGHTGPKPGILAAARGEAEAGADGPDTLTHDLRDPDHDPIQNALRHLNLNNSPEQRVHVIQVPIYLDGSDALIPETYYELLAGFDLTVFASFYEPWGYTPLESAGFGVPTVTSDLAGFGLWTAPRGDWKQTGCVVLARDGRAADAVVEELQGCLVEFTAMDVAQRAELDDAARANAGDAHWAQFIGAYYEAHDRALAEAGGRGDAMPRSRFIELAQRRVVTETPQGDAVTAHLRYFQVHNELPETLAPLRELASNYWWNWHPEARALFSHLDPELWERVDAAPLAFLEQISQEHLSKAAASHHFRQELANVHAAFAADTRPQEPIRIAYFCMEFGLAAYAHIYAGGLGILAGDHLKTSSDLKLPLCAIGLAYRDGYFRQLIAPDGQQQALADHNDFDAIGASLVTIGDGTPLVVTVPFPGRQVRAFVYQLRVGGIDLYLLDTDHAANQAQDRKITSRLYGGGSRGRLEQELILGVGGGMVLRDLELSPDVYHLNEGHSAFLILARMVHLMSTQGLDFEEALDFVRHTTIFTTHTPVPAGHDRFDESLILPYLAPFEEALRVDWQTLMRIGQGHSGGAGHAFGTTQLALHGSLRVNGVSKIHGAVTREMFQDEFPGYHLAEIPIGSITNGVHVATWVAPELQKLYQQHVDEDWPKRLDDQQVWGRVHEIDDCLLWDVHSKERESLLQWVSERLQQNWERRRESPSLIAGAQETLRQDPLVIGFARRVAPYKRAELVFSDVDRLAQILANQERPTVLLFAGKAHPADGLGAEILQRIVQLSRDPRLAAHIIVLENYDINVAKRLVAGCDIWLNTPTRPLEASGTSGMKAGMNGCLNLSVADGWWAEAYNGKNGWVIGAAGASESSELQNSYDGGVLLDLLEHEVLPAFADRDARGVPTRWVAMMKASIATCIPQFSSHRMVKDYLHRCYDPARADAHALRGDAYRGLRALRDLKRRLAENWENVKFGDVLIEGLESGQVSVSKSTNVRVELQHPGLEANELEVQVVMAHGTANGTLEDFNTKAMKKVEEVSSHASRWEVDLQWHHTGPHAIGLRVVPRELNAQGDVYLNLDLVRWL